MAYFLKGSYGGDVTASVGIVYYSRDGESNWTKDSNRKKLYATSALAQADIDSGIIFDLETEDTPNNDFGNAVKIESE